MDANEQFAFPSPQPNDSQEVRSAIEQAGILWAEDPKESLKWLRKAAEFASDAGDDLRSVQLARVSADLRNLANISPSLPPTTLPPPSALLAAAAAAAASAAVPQLQVVGEEPSSTLEGTESETAVVASGEPTGADSESSGGFTDPAGDVAADSPTEVTPNVPAVAAQAVAAGFGPQSFTTGVLGDAPFAQAVPLTQAVSQAAVSQAAVSQAAVSQAAGSQANEGAQPALTPEQVAAFIPQSAFLGKDPAQTVPATPAATAAAAALANGPSAYQPFGGFQTTGYGGQAPTAKSTPTANPASAPRWPESTPVNQASNPQVGGGSSPDNSAPNNGKLAMNTPAATPASKRPAAFGNTPSTWTGGPRPEQPTLVGSPLNGLRAEEAFRAEAAASDPSLASRFVQHRAIAVAVSMTPNNAGHFDLHPLAEGEQVEPGFRMALLVGLSADDRLFPGRG